jgi:hypothetical protein
MPRIRVPLNNFSFGEINPSLTSRTDSAVYNQAAETVKNFFIRAEGGVIKRPATERIYNFTHTYDSSLLQQIRIEPFVFSDDEKYIVAFSSGQLDIFRIIASTNVVSHIQTVTTDVDGNNLPINNDNLNQFTYAHRGDFMFIAHGDFLCRMLVRTGLTTFEVRVFEFDTSVIDGRKLQPYYNFQPNGVTLTSSATSGTGATLTSSAPYFTANHVGIKLLIGEAEAEITGFTNSTSVTADVTGTLQAQLDVDAIETKIGSNKIEITHALHGLSSGASITIANAGGVGGITATNINGARTISRIIDKNTYEVTAGANATGGAIGGGSPTIETGAATTEWYEQSYSAIRGFPAAVTFHEDRLWFGGTKSQPDGLWGSVTSQYFNFDLGDAEANDALDLDANIGQTNRIRHLVSNRDLQIFASRSEFYLPSFQDEPVTPENAKISSQTPFGTGFVRPQSIDGATMFVQSTGSAVREYIYSDAEGAYTGNMISLLSSHLIKSPLQLATVKGSLDRPGAYAFFLMNDGNISVYYSIRNEKRAGWVDWNTTGKFHSICSVEDDLYSVSVRDDGSGTDKLFLERFTSSRDTDFSDEFTGTNGVFTVSSHFANGAVVDVTDGDEYLGQFTVAGGQLDVSAVKTSSTVQAGYKFIPELKTLPVDGQVQGGFLTARPRRISMVDLDLNETLSVSVNGTDMVIRNVNFSIGSAPDKITGKKEFRPLGYSKDPRVTISQSAPLPLQINGLIAEVAF